MAEKCPFKGSLKKSHKHVTHYPLLWMLYAVKFIEWQNVIYSIHVVVKDKGKSPLVINFTVCEKQVKIERGQVLVKSWANMAAEKYAAKFRHND